MAFLSSFRFRGISIIFRFFGYFDKFLGFRSIFVIFRFWGISVIS